MTACCRDQLLLPREEKEVSNSPSLNTWLGLPVQKICLPGSPGEFIYQIQSFDKWPRRPPAGPSLFQGLGENRGQNPALLGKQKIKR